MAREPNQDGAGAAAAADLFLDELFFAFARFELLLLFSRGSLFRYCGRCELASAGQRKRQGRVRERPYDDSLLAVLSGGAIHNVGVEGISQERHAVRELCELGEWV